MKEMYNFNYISKKKKYYIGDCHIACCLLSFNKFVG